MELKQHGLWDAYVPDPWPDDAIPRAVMFRKERGHGRDWYEYAREEASFGVLTVKVVLARPNIMSPWEVIMANRDVTRIFPGDGCAVMEVLDDTGTTDGSEYRGRIYQGGGLVPKPVDLVDYSKKARYRKETSTLTVGPVSVAMDDRSKSLILGSYISAQRDPAWTTIWQAENGAFPVDAATMTTVFDAMTARISACFTAYASVAQGIAGGTITTTEQIDAAFADIP